MEHGLLLIDKPSGCTSHDVVARARKCLGQKDIGHTGTLDPLASGLMVLVLGEATKLSDYLTAEDKAYVADLRLGVTTDTLDRTGKILCEQVIDLSEDVITKAAKSLQGEFNWPIPMFSAKKVDGEKLYEKARRGEELTEPPRKKMNFKVLEVQITSPNQVKVALSCSKGSFIRTWVDQLGKVLAVGAHMEELRRTKVGDWRLENAVTLTELENKAGSDWMAHEAYCPMNQALPRLKTVMAGGPKEERLVLNGQIPRDIANRLVFEQKQAHETGQPVLIKVLSMQANLLAILAAEANQGLKIRRVFRTIA